MNYFSDNVSVDTVSVIQIQFTTHAMDKGHFIQCSCQVAAFKKPPFWGVSRDTLHFYIC